VEKQKMNGNVVRKPYLLFLDWVFDSLSEIKINKKLKINEQNCFLQGWKNSFVFGFALLYRVSII
jgi:hypothetical protein